MEKAMTDLPNIGPDTARLLAQVGIHTPQQLRAAGAREAWLRIYAVDPSACYNRLCGLEGAVRGVPKKLLDSETKASLKAFMQKARGSK